MPETSTFRVADFPATQWTMIEVAGRGTGADGRTCLIEFLRKYMVPMRVHLSVRFGMDEDTARDHVQSFIAEKVLERNLLGVADRTRGSRFRTFLLTSLDRFVAQRYEYATAAKRRPDGLMCLHDVADPPDRRLRGDIFDIEWARRVLGDAMTRMLNHCMVSARMDIWHTFQQRIWLPVATGQRTVSHRELAVELGLRGSSQAANLLITAKRLFERQLRAVVGEYCITEQEIQEELNDLCNVVRCPSA